MKTIVVSAQSSQEKELRAHTPSKIDGFTPLIDHATIAWIDYIIEDFEKEATESAAKVGFSDQLVKRLLIDVRGSYEDFDTEMGLLLPAIHADGFDVNVEPLLTSAKGQPPPNNTHTKEIPLLPDAPIRREPISKNSPKKMKPTDLLTLLLVRIIDENNSWNFKQLQEMDERSDDLTMDLKDKNIVRPT